MRFLKLAALILAIAGGYLGASSGSASATPLSAGALPAAAQTAENPLVQQTQYYGRRVYRPYRAYRPYRRVYRPIYRPRYYARPIYRGPRVVCRTRFTPFGPQRVCSRRW